MNHPIVENIMALHDEAAEAKAETIRLDYETWHRRFKRDAVHQNADDTRQALRAAIEQALGQGEPVARYLGEENEGSLVQLYDDIKKGTDLYTAPQPQTVPPWIGYDASTDVLTIHGKRYSAAMFGEDGFLAPPGTMLRVEQGQPDVVMATMVQPQPCHQCGGKLIEKNGEAR